MVYINEQARQALHRQLITDDEEMGKVEGMLFIATMEWSNIFPEDKERFRVALKKGGYILHQDRETGEFEIYQEA